MVLASRLSCITPEQPVPTTPGEVIIPAETPARVAMAPGSSLSCNILGNRSVSAACRTPDGGINLYLWRALQVLLRPQCYDQVLHQNKLCKDL